MEKVKTAASEGTVSAGTPAEVTVLAKKKKLGKTGIFFRECGKHYSLILMCIPAIIFFIAFSYAPLPGIYVAFVKYNYASGIFGSDFIGLDNFKFLFESGQMWKLTRNTILYNFAFLVLDNVVAMFMAILINEITNRIFKKITQTIMLLPYFISAVLVGLLVYNVLNYDYGFLNSVLRSLGLSRWAPYSNPKAWPPLIILVQLWQCTGYNTIVYFAAIMGIDSETIEAARIDGVNAFQRIWYIELPLLKPTLVILMLFAMGGIVKGNFGLFYNIIGTNALLYPTTDILETYVYRATMQDFNFSTASAIGFYQSVIGFVIVMICNAVIKKIEPEYSLF
ncbi:sugar ABC transporter permease [Treponema rectale]|uniref:Putative aldouronate transport system permease protein n=1 Tax=Treponema rectale TaxID=744512 RepID=A0A840S8W5_9SPIR|nr:ABC transporter permease subunit [Treponema rectale]MBB5219109.1 putative aldouronate transport system permease protein [Treponema rectale]QOS40989.1 sugar ABC transporter permease [Treponema rectale]